MKLDLGTVFHCRISFDTYRKYVIVIGETEKSYKFQSLGCKRTEKDVDGSLYVTEIPDIDSLNLDDKYFTVSKNKIFYDDYFRIYKFKRHKVIYSSWISSDNTYSVSYNYR